MIIPTLHNGKVHDSANPIMSGMFMVEGGTVRTNVMNRRKKVH